jgi:preprotein translocase subunit YajC
MNSFVDTIMLILFFAFMFFIFGGYHKDKYKQREEDEKNSKES